ncbi:hypothetical protein [Acinetobacter haemolyticus]|uniref:hypothetical protein n=1 Tax=Acinetobacter haemolyticus TaxID=29430 RepID=UPI003F54DC51
MPRITIRNLDTEINRRIKLIKTSTSTVEIGLQDGAVSDQSDSVHICLSPSSQCTPTEISGVNLLSNDYPSKLIEYRLNDGDFIQIEIENFNEYLTSALFASVMFNAGFDALFTEGGYGYFGVAIGNSNFTVIGSDGLNAPEAINVTLRDITGNTIIQDMFGLDEITLHTCGAQIFFE